MDIVFLLDYPVISFYDPFCMNVSGL
jgi:hypothetical protein